MSKTPSYLKNFFPSLHTTLEEEKRLKKLKEKSKKTKKENKNASGST